MKHKKLTLLAFLALILTVSSSFADHRFNYGYRGYYYDDPGGRYDQDGYVDSYAPRKCKSKHIDVYYEPDGYDDSYPEYDDDEDWNRDDDDDYGSISNTPVLAGSLIGGVIGAQIGGTDTAAYGGALLGASIGRDIAYRRAYRH